MAQSLVVRATVSLKGFTGAPGRSGAIRFRWALNAYESASAFIYVRGGLFISAKGNEKDAFNKLIQFILVIKEH